MTLNATASPGHAAERTRVLGLVIPMRVKALFSDPYLVQLIQGVSAAANAHDHTVMLWVAEPDYERRAISRVMQTGLLDGIILASQLNDDPLLQALIGGQPAVRPGGPQPDQRSPQLHRRGQHQQRPPGGRTTCCGWGAGASPPSPGRRTCAPGADREEGYLTALRQRGLAVDPNLIVGRQLYRDGA